MCDQNIKRLAKADRAGVYSAALGMLTYREHSFFEMCCKLEKKGADRETAHAVVSQLKDEGWQSDVRFAESYVSFWAVKGRGLHRIQMELKAHRLTRELILQALNSRPFDWIERACDAYTKKYGEHVPDNYSECAKRMRFLRYRGFDRDEIFAAFERIRRR